MAYFLSLSLSHDCTCTVLCVHAVGEGIAGDSGCIVWSSTDPPHHWFHPWSLEGVAETETAHWEHHHHLQAAGEWRAWLGGGAWMWLRRGVWLWRDNSIDSWSSDTRRTQVSIIINTSIIGVIILLISCMNGGRLFVSCTRTTAVFPWGISLSR